MFISILWIIHISYVNRDWCRFHSIKFGNFSYSLCEFSVVVFFLYGKSLICHPQMDLWVSILLHYFWWNISVAIRFPWQKLIWNHYVHLNWKISFIPKSGIITVSLSRFYRFSCVRLNRSSNLFIFRNLFWLQNSIRNININKPVLKPVLYDMLRAPCQ